jgi:hypothetical protein
VTVVVLLLTIRLNLYTLVALLFADI